MSVVVAPNVRPKSLRQRGSISSHPALGFVHALQALGDTTVCAPAQNTADEERWACMRWVHEDYGAHKDMSAGDALLMTLREKFACG